MKTRVLMVVALMAAVCASAVWSQGGPRPGRQGRPGGPGMLSTAAAIMPPQAGMFDHLSETLQLTDDQAAKLKAAGAQNEATIRPLAQKAAEATQAVHAAVLASSYDAQNVKDLAAKAEKAEAEVVAASIEAWTQIRSILTDDQVTALKAAMSAPRPGAGRAPGGPPPEGGGAPPPGPNGAPPPGPDGNQPPPPPQ